jgi:hypothetical protein
VDTCADYDPAIGCRWNCHAAAQRLTSDPASPLEPAIVPLVFELKRLGVFCPCWSCEGHDDAEGRLTKLPRVWFYAQSVVHVRVLAETIDGISAMRPLSAPWRVAVTYSDPDNPDTTFSLEPELGGEGGELSRLQDDARRIAEGLDPHFWIGCARLQRLAR